MITMANLTKEERYAAALIVIGFLAVVAWLLGFWVF